MTAARGGEKGGERARRCAALHAEDGELYLYMVCAAAGASRCKARAHASTTGKVNSELQF